MANTGINIPINLKVKLSQMGDYLKEVKDAFSNIRPDTRGYAELESKLRRINREFEAIKLNSYDTFRSHGQINTFSRRFERLNSLIDDFGKGFNNLSLDDLNNATLNPGLVNSISKTKSELDGLRETLSQTTKDNFKDLILANEELKSSLESLQIAPEDLLEGGQGFSKIADEIKTITDRVKELKTEQNKKNSKLKTSEDDYRDQEAKLLDIEQRYNEAAGRVRKLENNRAAAENRKIKAEQQYNKQKARFDSDENLLKIERDNFKNKQNRAELGKDFFGEDGKFLEKGKEAFAKHFIENFSLTQDDLKAAGIDKVTESSLGSFYSALLSKIKEKRDTAQKTSDSVGQEYKQTEAEVQKAQAEANKLFDQYEKGDAKLKNKRDEINTLNSEVQKLEQDIKKEEANIKKNEKIIETSQKLSKQASDMADGTDVARQIKDLETRLQQLEAQLRDCVDEMQNGKKALENLGGDSKNAEKDIQNLNKQLDALTATEQKISNVQSAIRQWFGFNEVINLTKRTVSDAVDHIRDLDKVMTEIAVVTDMDQDDLWQQIDTYSKIAQEYGVSTVGVYEVSQLYYQQGLGMTETMQLTEETLKMAKIAGIDYSDATDYMTVAIRGFKMEMSDAQNVVDVYSNIAAITASDTEELAVAMSKTASSAEAVGSSFEHTTAMIALMVETTREAPQKIYGAYKKIL